MLKFLFITVIFFCTFLLTVVERVAGVNFVSKPEKKKQFKRLATPGINLAT
jgi:hypothetical protein